VLIAEAGLAIAVDALVEDGVTTTHDHPTLSETLMEAAADEFDRAIHG
jgi:pyruvate/2-oxoglutarate dehydrogenase complex dihydrolipoamide dehydrogenase (E3) component